jgi:hypothetical protein
MSSNEEKESYNRPGPLCYDFKKRGPCPFILLPIGIVLFIGGLLMFFFVPLLYMGVAPAVLFCAIFPIYLSTFVGSPKWCLCWKEEDMELENAAVTNETC